MKSYIQGQRRGKEANQLERKAMDDPFLRDAIDGYDSVEGDHISVIETLEKRLSSPQKPVNKQMWIWFAAAAIILLIGIPLLLHQPEVEDDTTIASSKITQKKETETVLLKEDTVLLADLHESNKEEILRETKKTVNENIEVDKISNVGKTEEIAESVSDKEIRLSATEPAEERISMGDPQKEVTGKLSGNTAKAIASHQTQDKSIRIRGISTAIVQENAIVVSGRIVDETGEPLVGVSIQLSDTHEGTVSDMSGNFQIIVPKDKQETLIASYIGMKNAEIPLIENVGDITMKSDDMALNEAVVIGYGTQRKKMKTGAVSTLKEKPIFEEENFKDFFRENYSKDICSGQNITIVVEFFIDPAGRPSQINIKENSCSALESEIKRLLLGSPLWSKTNRKVTLQIEIP